MSRNRISMFLPSLLAGGLLFGGAGYADDGRSAIGFWPAVSDVTATGAAKGSATKPVPTTPSAPTPPTQAKPPKPPKTSAGGGVSVSFDNGKLQIGGIEQLVNDQLQSALDTIKNDPNIPPAVRAKLDKRLAKVRGLVKKRLGNLKATDLDQLGEELDKMGDELGAEMEQFGEEMEKWGKDFEHKMGKDLAKKMKGLAHLDLDFDVDDDLHGVPDLNDPDDLDDAIRDLGDLNLKPPQRDQIKKLRVDSDAKVTAAKKELDKASDLLRKQLEDPAATDLEVTRSIDAVTRQEAEIRKARILAWRNARRVLDDAQRKRVQGAAKSK